MQPRVALIATGGTIDAVGASRTDLAWYTETRQRLGEGELLASVAELADIAAVEPVSFRRMPSYTLTAADWLDLARMVRALLTDPDCDAVVITHGTNTLEETAFFLDLTVRSDKPVVLVGALRPASAIGSDGQLNLLRAVQVAAAPEARGHGVLVIMNDTIHAARDVTKGATFRVHAFESPDTGPLGYADADGRVLFYHRPVAGGRGVFDPGAVVDLPRVDIVVSYVGADGALIDAAVAVGARGIVSAGTGAGYPTAAENEALDRAVAAGLVVVQSTRVGAGRVVRAPTMASRKLVAGENLQPWKARVLLALALTRTADPERVQELFDEV